LPLTPVSTGLGAKGFNQVNFPAIWSGAPSGFTPQLTDVRLFTRGTLAGSFTVTNTNTGAPILVNSPALTFKENSNNMNSTDLATSNSTGTVPAAILRSRQTTTTTPPGDPPISSTDPASSRYCPGNNWIAGIYDAVDQEQSWTCTTAQVASFNINPVDAPTSTNWSLIGGGNSYGIASSFWSGNTISIPSMVSLTFSGFTPSAQSATFTLDGSGANNYLEYTYN
jgi:hypothetical protein